MFSTWEMELKATVSETAHSCHAQAADFLQYLAQCATSSDQEECGGTSYGSNYQFVLY